MKEIFYLSKWECFWGRKKVREWMRKKIKSQAIEIKYLKTEIENRKDSEESTCNWLEEMFKIKDQLEKDKQELIDCLVDIIKEDYCDFISVIDYQEWYNLYEKEIKLLSRLTNKSIEELLK